MDEFVASVADNHVLRGRPKHVADRALHFVLRSIGIPMYVIEARAHGRQRQR